MNTSFKINNFDLLRILAATQVVGVHIFAHMDLSAPAWLSPLLDAFPGVPIFFAISGFLISASYERSSDLRSYARNRVLRIFPGLWCCIFLTIFVAILFGFDFRARAALVWAASQLVGVIYTPRFLQGFGFGSYNGALWTIPIELQFYLLMPALYWFAPKAGNNSRFWLVWCTFVVIAFCLRGLFPQMDSATGFQKLVRYSFFPHFYLFLTGVLLQRSGAQKQKWLAGKGLYWLAGYLGLVFLFRLFAPVPSLPYAAINMTFMLALAFLTVAAAYTFPGVSHRILRGNDISYGVYIYHGLIMNVFIELGLVGHLRYAALLVCCTYVAGYLSWIAVERRFLRRKQQTISVRFDANAPALEQGSPLPIQQDSGA